MPIRDEFKRDLKSFLDTRDLYHHIEPGSDGPPESAEERVRRGWAEHQKAFEAGLGEATPRGRELLGAARAYLEAGMPLERRDPTELAAFFECSTLTYGQGYPTPGDFGRRWQQVGGLPYVADIGLRAGRLRCVNLQGWERLALIDLDAGQSGLAHDPGFRLLLWLKVPLAAASEAERQSLHEHLEPKVATMPVGALAALAVGCSDPEWARLAVERQLAQAPAPNAPRTPFSWPTSIFDVLQDGKAYADLFLANSMQFQFFGPGYMARAALRLPEADLARALVGLFEAALKPKSGYNGTYVKKFVKIATCVDDPQLARFFAEHGEHKWMTKAAALYAERFGGSVSRRR